MNPNTDDVAASEYSQVRVNPFQINLFKFGDLEKHQSVREEHD
jgi:hypothetical protein